MAGDNCAYILRHLDKERLTQSQSRVLRDRYLLAVPYPVHRHRRHDKEELLQSGYCKLLSCFEKCVTIDALILQLWCWIGEQYFPDKVAGEYLWLWATLFVSFLTYLPLFLWSRGNITVHQVKWWKVQWHWRARTAADVEFEARARPNAPSLALLACVLNIKSKVLTNLQCSFIGIR